MTKCLPSDCSHVSLRIWRIDYLSWQGSAFDIEEESCDVLYFEKAHAMCTPGDSSCRETSRHLFDLMQDTHSYLYRSPEECQAQCVLDTISGEDTIEKWSLSPPANSTNSRKQLFFLLNFWFGSFKNTSADLKQCNLKIALHMFQIRKTSINH